VRHDAQLLGLLFQPLEQEEAALGAASPRTAACSASSHSWVSAGSLSRAAATS
jgi:hypothetical protein